MTVMEGKPLDGSGASQQLVLIRDDTTVAPASMPIRQRRDLVLGIALAVILAITALYNFAIATPRYGSEMSFVVRTPSGSRQRLTFMNLGSAGGSGDDSQAIVAYMRSRDLLAQIDADRFLTRLFSADGIDAFSAFPSLLAGHSREQFYRHVQKYVEADFDPQTDITTVSVQAFRADDARKLAERIMLASEAKVNQLNSRARNTMIESSAREVDDANRDLTQVLGQLAAVQNRFGVIEPKLEAGAAIKLSSGTAAELTQIDIQLANTLRAAPQSPQIAELRARRAAIEASLQQQLAATAGGTNSLALRISPYIQLAAQRDIAEKRLLGASLALASARNSASSGRIYIEWIARPSQPDIPTYPRRGLNLLLVLLVAGGVLWIVRSLSDLVLDDD